MSKEAMKLALEALENSIDLVEEDYANAVNLYGKYPSRAKRLIGMETMRDDHRKAITALREALAEQPAQQEPVAWRVRCTEPQREWVLMYKRPTTELQFSNMEIQPLYTSPPTLSLAQRTWVGLTDEEIDKTHETKVWDARRSYARAIEAKLKEKNT